MFCPKCATQNIDGAHFCRSCGANISLVPSALTGQLPASPDDESVRRKHREKQPSFHEGVRTLIMGFGFVAVAVALALFGRQIGAQVWWFWLLIPAFAMMGKGVADILRANQLKDPSSPNQPRLSYDPPREGLPSRHPGELRAPVSSVTEGTTRHLGAEAPTRNFDSWENQKPS